MLDFYRGTLSARLLGVYVRQLPAESATTRATCDGVPPLTRTEHFLADLWAQLEQMRNPKRQSVDHPRRAGMEEKARIEAKRAKVIELRAKFEKRKHTYGLNDK